MPLCLHMLHACGERPLTESAPFQNHPLTKLDFLAQIRDIKLSGRDLCLLELAELLKSKRKESVPSIPQCILEAGHVDS